jgi:hypothetical protein
MQLALNYSRIFLVQYIREKIQRSNHDSELRPHGCPVAKQCPTTSDYCIRQSNFSDYLVMKLCQ